VFAVAHRLRPRNAGGRWDVPSAYPVQAAAGTAQIPMCFILATLLAGPGAGLLAAGAIAFYPPLIDASGDLLTEPLGALMLLVALIAVVLALRRPRARTALLAGLLLGLSVLVRADLLPVPFALAALMAGSARRVAGRRSGVIVALAAVAGIMATLGPWSAYVSSRSGRFVPVSSGGASNLYVGTYVPGDGTMFGLKREWAGRVRRAHPSLRDDPPWRLSQRTVIDTVAASRPDLGREAALRAAAKDNARRYLVGDPGAFAAMALRKVARLWLRYTVGTHRHRRRPIEAYHVFLVLLGAIGLTAACVVSRGREPGFWAAMLVVGCLTAMNVVLVSEARHNLPVMPVLVSGGVAGWAVVAARLRPRRRGSPDRVEGEPDRASRPDLDAEPARGARAA
jgi:4-amino-4-deoxy-L-arabinose transferase-like glycosyltransferase